MDDLETIVLEKIKNAIEDYEIIDNQSGAEIENLTDFSIDFVEELGDGADVYDVYGETAAIFNQERTRPFQQEPLDPEEVEVTAIVRLRVIIYQNEIEDITIEDLIYEDNSSSYPSYFRG